MSIEGIPKKQDQSEQKERNIEINEHFRSVMEDISNLDDGLKEKPLIFEIFSVVEAPSMKDSQKLEEWSIVHKEKGHYLLENNSGHKLCDEEELIEWGNSPEDTLTESEPVTNKIMSLPAEFSVLKGFVLKTPSSLREIITGASDEQLMEMDEQDLRKLQDRL